jgi:lysophospholipase L1-like esterase
MLAPGTRYVALGSSFAAGPGIDPPDPEAPRAAGRSAANYPHLVAERLGLDLVDATWSGATTTDLLQGHGRRPAQLAAVTPDTGLVTVTAGGNDIDYLSTILTSSLPRAVRSIPPIRRRIRRGLDPDSMRSRIAAMRSGLDLVLTRIERHAPDARVVLVGYLTIFPEDVRAVVELQDARWRTLARWATATAARMDAVYAELAERHGCDYVDAGDASAEHHAWSADPWTHRLRFGRRDGVAYHPTPAGMRAVADMVASVLSPDATA